MNELKKSVHPTVNIVGAAAFKENLTCDSQSVCGEKIEMKLCDESLPQVKCDEDASIFNYDSSVNLSEPESETSKEVESRSFDFFLEGERLVSSLCGPKVDDKLVEENECDQGFGEPQVPNHSGSSSTITDKKFEPYNNLECSVALMSTRDDECLLKKIVCFTEDFHPSYSTDTDEKSTGNNNNSTRDSTSLERNRSALSSGLSLTLNKDEFKAKPFSRNYGFTRKRLLADMSKNTERSSPFKMNNTELKSSLQYALGSTKNKNDSQALTYGINAEIKCASVTAEATTSHSKGHPSYSIDASKMSFRKTSEGAYGDQKKTCDDEISFRKSAIEASVLFEQIIREFQLSNNFEKLDECELESYCKNVKRCVSISNSLESDRALVVMTELIKCSLRLANSWSTLNSYFAANGDNKNKSKSEDDCRLFKIFKEWQVSSNMIIDCLVVVIQNMRSSIPKPEKNTSNNLNLRSINSTFEYNPFFNSRHSQYSLNKIEQSFPSHQAESEKKDQDCSKQQGSLQLENAMTSVLNVFSRSSSKSSSSSGKNQDPSDMLLEIQQTAHSLVNKQPSGDKKLRRKWTLTSSDTVSNRINLTNYIPLQGVNPFAQNQIESSLPLNSVFPGPAPQMNKSIFERVPMQTINFMPNPFGVTSQTTNTNSSIPQLNFMNQQTGMSLKFKQPVQNKDINSMFKAEEILNKELSGNQGSGGAIFNQAPGLNRANTCNQHQINFMPFQNNLNSQPFNYLNDQKNKLLYRTSFCFPDGKVMPVQPPLAQDSPQPPSASFFYPSFCSNEMYQPNVFNNQYIQDKRPKTLADNTDGDDTETYSQIKSYMKPGSYKVPSKCTLNSIVPSDNLNYIFEDIVVAGITVPLKKTESLSPSKKTSLKSGSTLKKNPQPSTKQKDSAWRAAVASAEELSKLVETFKNQSSRVAAESNKQNSEENGQEATCSKVDATDSSTGFNTEHDSKQGDSSTKSE